jgi:hypothetical protein
MFTIGAMGKIEEEKKSVRKRGKRRKEGQKAIYDKREKKRPEFEKRGSSQAKLKKGQPCIECRL